MGNGDIPTIHGSACVIGSAGVLIRGPSGSGKSSLCLALISTTTAHAGFARLVADDRVILDQNGDRLIARAPDALSGMAELYGLGIIEMPVLSACCLDLVVDMVEEGNVERFPETEENGITVDHQFIRIPRISVPRRNTAIAMPLVLTRLRKSDLS